MAFGDPKNPASLPDDSVKEASRPNFLDKYTKKGLAIGVFKAACLAGAAVLFHVGIVGACVFAGLGMIAIYRDVSRGIKLSEYHREAEFKEAQLQQVMQPTPAQSPTIEQAVERSGINYRTDHVERAKNSTNRQVAQSK